MPINFKEKTSFERLKNWQILTLEKDFTIQYNLKLLKERHTTKAKKILTISNKNPVQKKNNKEANYQKRKKYNKLKDNTTSS
uniref:Uncharacterized protein n=1 Tax=Panagrolaimus sp. ES5 TaxID=591445 RepID=A0AC34FBC7_9BILA